jgi:hypothetical protein
MTASADLVAVHPYPGMAVGGCHVAPNFTPKMHKIAQDPSSHRFASMRLKSQK